MNVSQDFTTGDSRSSTLAAQQWMSTQLQSLFTLVNTPGAWPTGTNTTNAVYRTEVYALRGAAQSAQPVHFEIAYSAGPNAASASFAGPTSTIRMGAGFSGGALLNPTPPITSGAAGNTLTEPFRMTVTGHRDGCLLTCSHNGASASPGQWSIRIGRVSAGQTHCAVMGMYSSSSAGSGAHVWVKRGEDSMWTLASLSTPSLLGSIQQNNGDGLIARSAILPSAGGIIEPEFVPMEFWMSHGTDWPGGGNRQVQVNGRLITLSAPTATNVTASNYQGVGTSSAALRALAPSVDFS